jgi:Gpi18-like mannosyltransferase
MSFASRRRAAGAVEPPLAPARHLELSTLLVPPLIAFVFSRILLSWVARSAGFKPLLAETWSRWDSSHYLSIATGGYEFFSCAQLPGFNPGEFCGNAAWLPGYPLLIRLLSAFGPTPEQSGVLIAAGFTLACLVLLWNAFLGPDWNARGLLALTLAAFFPGHVYYHAIFPISMCLFFQLAAIGFYASERFWLAGLAGAVAAFSYSSGFFLAAVFGFHLLLWHRKEPLGNQALTQLQVTGLTFAGFLAVLVLLRIEVGVWNAYQLVQAKYHYTFTFPWIPVTDHLLKLSQPGVGKEHQAGFVAVLVGLLVWAAFRHPRRPLDTLLVVFALIYWLTPLMLGPGYAALVRSESMLLPAIPLAKKLPIGVLVALVIVAVGLALRLDGLFFVNSLV